MVSGEWFDSQHVIGNPQRIDVFCLMLKPRTHKHVTPATCVAHNKRIRTENTVREDGE